MIEVEPAIVTVNFRSLSASCEGTPQEAKTNIERSIVKQVTPIFMLELFGRLQVSDDPAFYEEYDQFGYIHGVIGHPLEVLDDKK